MYITHILGYVEPRDKFDFGVKMVVPFSVVAHFTLPIRSVSWTYRSLADEGWSHKRIPLQMYTYIEQ
jgi:hypothetical protein